MFLICGCASTNCEKADAASESLQKAGKQIQVESHTIDLTVVASARAQKASDVAHKKSADYFESWD